MGQKNLKIRRRSPNLALFTAKNTGRRNKTKRFKTRKSLIPEKVEVGVDLGGETKHAE